MFKLKSKHGNTRKSMGIRNLMKHLWSLTVCGTDDKQGL